MVDRLMRRCALIMCVCFEKSKRMRKRSRVRASLVSRGRRSEANSGSGATVLVTDCERTALYVVRSRTVTVQTL